MVCRILTQCEAEGAGELVRRFVWVKGDRRGGARLVATVMAWSV
jgi:hypothetical protein